MQGTKLFRVKLLSNNNDNYITTKNKGVDIEFRDNSNFCWHFERDKAFRLYKLVIQSSTIITYLI